MKINYMFSRIDRDKGFNDNQKKYIKEDIKNDMKEILLRLKKLLMYLKI